VTLLASITEEGVGPCLAVESSTTREVFEAYLEQHLLAPTLRPGQVIVLDNLSAHKGGRVKEIVEGRGCELMYLPPYSPDFNPIEQVFSKVKGLLRKTQARTREALIEAMGRALDAVPVRDIRGVYWHCGYRLMDQLL
jgi:transposase